MRTDIPAFYGEWFLNRLRAGFCRVVNPFNRAQHMRVSLSPGDVDGFVFWTKNLTPFLPVLAEVRERGFPFVIQHTINGYPRELESRVVDATQSVGNLHEVARRYGRDAAVWRYDTIVLTTSTDWAWHRANFARLAAALEGATDECVVSFVQMYRKTRVHMAAAEVESGFRFLDASDVEKCAMLEELAGVARDHGMRLSLCAQPQLLTTGVEPAHCVDARRMERVSGRPIKAVVKGPREGCLCYASRDIGEYDTCPHGCIYCYAVQDRQRALARWRLHDPQGAYLFPPETQPGRQMELL